MSIKQLKPSRNSRFKQGYYDVSNSAKYCGTTECIYRSGLEKKFFDFFENNERIEKWESEPENCSVKYFYKGKLRTYWIDASFFANGKTFIAEIKPFAQTKPPKDSRNPITNKRALDTYEQNIAKWEAATKWAETQGYTFIILTEKFFDR